MFPCVYFRKNGRIRITLLTKFTRQYFFLYSIVEGYLFPLVMSRNIWFLNGPLAAVIAVMDHCVSPPNVLRQISCEPFPPRARRVSGRGGHAFFCSRFITGCAFHKVISRNLAIFRQQAESHYYCFHCGSSLPLL